MAVGHSVDFLRLLDSLKDMDKIKKKYRENTSFFLANVGLGSLSMRLLAVRLFGIFYLICMLKVSLKLLCISYFFPFCFLFIIKEVFYEINT